MVLELSAQEMSTLPGSGARTGESTESGTLTEVRLSSKVVLFDDEEHSYDYVVEMLTHCCEMSREAAFRCAFEVDMTGRTIVFHGDFDECKTCAINPHLWSRPPSSPKHEFHECGSAALAVGSNSDNHIFSSSWK